MKMQDVRKIAKTKGINSFGKTKVDLIREIQKAEGSFDCFKTAGAFCDQDLCSFRTDCLEPLPPSKNKLHEKR
jgi:hypothetical protein